MSEDQLKELGKQRARTRAGGGTDRVAKQHAKGKLTARERLDLLLDKGSFHELESYMTHRGDPLGIMADQEIPGDGVVTGYGTISGSTVFVYAQDFTVFGGTLGEMHAAKICRVIDLAIENRKPVIGLLDSGGARIQEGVRALRGYAEIFKRNALASGVIPQISVMLGPCAGGAAYSPALTDVIIMVEKKSFMFLTGPEVIKAVTNETVDHETLGGTEVHTCISGTAHLSATNEEHAFVLVRNILAYLQPQNNVKRSPGNADLTPRPDPFLNHIVPTDKMEPYSMHSVIEKVTDEGSWIELMPSWAKNAIIGLARFGGRPVGMVANEPEVIAGVLDIDSADKITRFVRFCDAFDLPIITFVDSPGFLPGITQEYGGVIRHGAKVLYAYAEATVPKISIVTRKAYGGAYIVMSSKFLGSDMNFAWPSAEIAVMGADGAVNILFREIKTKEERQALTEKYDQHYSRPFAAAAYGTVDEIIEPANTRIEIIAALQALQDKRSSRPDRKHGNMPV